MAGSRTHRVPKLMVNATDVETKWAAQDAATALVQTNLDDHETDLSVHREINDAGIAVTDLWSADKITTELLGKIDTPLVIGDFPDDLITPVKLDIDNAETDTYVLAYDLASTSFKWVERVKTDGSNLAAASITEAMLNLFTAPGAGVDNFAICWDNGNTRLDYMEMILADLSNMPADSITEDMLELQLHPGAGEDGYALVWDNANGKFTVVDISAAVGSDTYKVKWDAADGEDYLEAKIPRRITVNTSLYIDPAGDDVTGDGSAGTPWKSLAQCMTYLADFTIDHGVTVTIVVGAGNYAAMGSVNVALPSCQGTIDISNNSTGAVTYTFAASGITLVTNTRLTITGGAAVGGTLTLSGTGGAGSGLVVSGNGKHVNMYGWTSIVSFAKSIDLSYGAYIYNAGSLTLTSTTYGLQITSASFHNAGALTATLCDTGIYAIYGASMHGGGTITITSNTTYGIYARYRSAVGAQGYTAAANGTDYSPALSSGVTQNFANGGSVIWDY